MIPYSRQRIFPQDIRAVSRVLKSDWITQGPAISHFEAAIARRVRIKHAVAVSSGTAALHLACLASGLEPQDEVITSPLTFLASANCILYCNAKPAFADIDEETGNISPAEIARHITRNTRALLPVHFSGMPCALDEIHALARRKRLIVIEDAAHALGAKYLGRPIGGLSDFTVFSFHPVKTITTGEGGMITCRRSEDAERMRLLRHHGMRRVPSQGPWYYEVHELGYNYRITDFQCALGLSQLNHLKMFLTARKRIAAFYRKAFEDHPAIELLREDPAHESAHHLFVLLLRLENLRLSRRQVFDELRARGLGVQVHYIPIHLQPYYRKRFGYRKGDFPKAERFYERAITLPLYPSMSEREVRRVVKVIRGVMNSALA